MSRLPGRFAIVTLAFGLLNLFRQLAASRPLLVAVDDLQWLDQPTAEMLAFAVRRLHGPSVRFLLAARAGSSSAVERALAPAGPQILEVRPLSVGAMRRMLSAVGANEGIEILLNRLSKTQSNAEFLASLTKNLEA